MEGVFYYKSDKCEVDLSSYEPQVVKEAFEKLGEPDMFRWNQCGLCDTCQDNHTMHIMCDGGAPENHRYKRWYEEVEGLIYLLNDWFCTEQMDEIQAETLKKLGHFMRPSEPEYAECDGCEAGAECLSAHTCVS